MPPHDRVPLRAEPRASAGADQSGLASELRHCAVAHSKVSARNHVEQIKEEGEMKPMYCSLLDARFIFVICCRAVTRERREHKQEYDSIH